MNPCGYLLRMCSDLVTTLDHSLSLGVVALIHFVVSEDAGELSFEDLCEDLELQFSFEEESSHRVTLNTTPRKGFVKDKLKEFSGRHQLIVGELKMKPRSCDTFVVLPPLTAHGGIVFGKNSDRPNGEVQELVYQPAQEHSAGSKLKCTYISVDQVEQTHAVILSKPSWMWGAEMGANDCGVVVGNEAVWSRITDLEDLEEKLLGMDLVRLALERSENAEHAVDVITQLLETYGQGGPCSDTDPFFTYHNSFLIADPKEAWVLETADKEWAAERISGSLWLVLSSPSSDTSEAEFDGLKLANGAQRNPPHHKGDFHFTRVYSKPIDLVEGKRQKCGRNLLANLSKDNSFSVSSMFTVLRDQESGICRPPDDSFPTTGSQYLYSVHLHTVKKSCEFTLGYLNQVSVLSPFRSGKPHCHWFTATPNPQLSVFKPFIFTPKVRISKHTQSPVFQPDPVQIIPRFESTVDRSHTLYRLHHAATLDQNTTVISLLQEMERNCVAEVEKLLADFKESQSLDEVDDLLKDIVETEVKFYK
uniref:Secernin-2 n=1 Tax=Timema genevievae TaxID=629358 RepID=A0A7R9PPT0_TIMGE|nr:unnamed protein product [Timema genevievae]